MYEFKTWLEYGWIMYHSLFHPWNSMFFFPKDLRFLDQGEETSRSWRPWQDLCGGGVDVDIESCWAIMMCSDHSWLIKFLWIQVPVVGSDLAPPFCPCAGRFWLARAWLLHVLGDESGSLEAPRALCCHVQSELRGPPGPSRPHPFDEPGHGSCCSHCWKAEGLGNIRSELCSERFARTYGNCFRRYRCWRQKERFKHLQTGKWDFCTGESQVLFCYVYSRFFFQEMLRWMALVCSRHPTAKSRRLSLWTSTLNPSSGRLRRYGFFFFSDPSELSYRSFRLELWHQFVATSASFWFTPLAEKVWTNIQNDIRHWKHLVAFRRLKRRYLLLGQVQLLQALECPNLPGLTARLAMNGWLVDYYFSHTVASRNQSSNRW